MIWRYGKFAAPWCSYSKCSPFNACMLQPLYDPHLFPVCVSWQWKKVVKEYKGTISVQYKLIHGVLSKSGYTGTQ